MIKLSRERSICQSVGALFCPVHCGKMADQIRIPYGILARTGPRMRQIVGFGDDGPRECVLLGANLARSIVTNGNFTAHVCSSASTVGAAVWGGACGGSRHCCITWGPRHARGRRGFGVFSPMFTMGNAIGSPMVKCFGFVCENLTTFSFGRHIIGKLDSGGNIFSFKIKVGVYEKLAKK